MSLFARFFLILLGFALVPVGIVGVWVYNSDEMVRENVRAFHEESVRHTAEALEEFAADLNRSLGFTADLERARRIGVSEEFKVLQSATAQPQLVFLSVVGQNGKEYLRSAEPHLFPKVVYEDRSGDALVQLARSTGRFAIGPAAQVSGVPVLWVAYPLAEGRVLYLAHSLERLWKRILRDRIGRSGRLGVADADGRLLAGLAEGFPDPQEQGRGIKGEGGWIETKGWVGAYRKAPSLNWYAVSFQPPEEAFLRSGTFHLKLVVGLAVLGLCALAVAFVVTRKLAAPLEELILGAERVARNEMDRPVTQGGWGKLSELARSFNQMMQKLKAYQDLRWTGSWPRRRRSRRW